MIYYRLLRDNKETGPYSEEEMIAKGFKPYDLLWAEGRSAGWQYPSEINAFKKYAPIIEEQPYDRFYKKQPAQKSVLAEERNKIFSPAPSPAKATEIMQPAQQPAARPAYNYNVQDLPARHIHVTLPSGNTLNLTTLVAKKETATSKEAEGVTAKTEKITPEKKHPSFAETIAVPPPVAKETTTIAITADQKPVKNYPGNYPGTLPVYQASSNTGFSWTLVLGAVTGIATMVGLGIMIGLSMNRDKNNTAFNEALYNKTKSSAVTDTKPAKPATTVIPVTVTVEPPVTQRPVTPTKNKDLAQHALVKATLAPGNTIKEENPPLATGNTAADKNKPTQSVEEAPQHPKTLPAVNTVNIEKSLQVSSNDFKTGAFGGISGLTCTLYNGSKLPLESVEVEVDYIQANNKIYKTEKLLFKSISAGAQATIDAPASSRGVKIISRIIKITPRETPLSNTTVKS